MKFVDYIFRNSKYLFALFIAAMIMGCVDVVENEPEIDETLVQNSPSELEPDPDALGRVGRVLIYNGTRNDEKLSFLRYRLSGNQNPYKNIETEVSIAESNFGAMTTLIPNQEITISSLSARLFLISECGKELDFWYGVNFLNVSSINFHNLIVDCEKQSNFNFFFPRVN